MARVSVSTAHVFLLQIWNDLTQGLNPTLIIILVATQISTVEHYSIHSTEMQSTHVPTLGPLGDSSVSQHVLVIQREYASDSAIQVSTIVSMKSSDEEKTTLAVTFGR